MEYKQIVYDGEKSMPLRDLPKEAWRNLTGGEGPDSALQAAYKAVPWLFRAVAIRSSTISRVPFAILQGDTEIDTSEDYQNKLGFLPNPRQLIGRVESSLTLLNRAYLFKEYNRARTLGLRYLLPASIKPKIDSEQGLTGFERWVKGHKTDFGVDDIVYFWNYALDPFTEIGEPQASPGTAALAAAGVLMSVDKFAAMFFDRGAIKTTILSVPKGTQKDERDRLSDKWQNIVSGAKNAWKSFVMNADTVTPVVIGEGIKELSNVELTKEKREDIATALGVPHSLLFSNAATFATARQDDIHMHNKVVLSEVEFIQEVFNEQIFAPLGYYWEFRPESMEIFQEEEVKRSAAYVNYVRGDIPPIPALKILGVDLPSDITEEELEAEILAWMQKKSEFRPSFGSGNPMDNQRQPEDPTTSASDGIRAILDTWERHAVKALSVGKSIKGTKGAPEFDHEGKLDVSQAAALGGALNNAKTVTDVRRIFEDARRWADEKNLWENYP